MEKLATLYVLGALALSTSCGFSGEQSTGTAVPADLRINSAGKAEGAFLADGHVAGGLPSRSPSAIDVSRVHAPAPQAVYQSARWGDFTYTFNGLTPGAFYTVRMHFAELYWNRAGARVFNVTINGTSALSDFDIFKTAGAANAALVEEFTAKPDSNGAMTIVYKGVVDNAQSNGIEILGVPTPPHTPRVKLLEDPPFAWSPDGKRYWVNKEDKNDIFQLYVGKRGDKMPTCVTSAKVPGGPRPEQHKYMACWHPSSKWIIIGVEREDYFELRFLPAGLRKGFVECGMWLDIYATTADGSRWYKLVKTTGGYTGVAFTPDGKYGAWADAVDSPIKYPCFGLWKLMLSEFVEKDGGLAVKQSRDISPPGAVWLEPGNFSPDGQSLVITADIGIKDNQGMDQYILDIKTGKLTNLTRSPKVWDEHGLFTPDGKQIIFMSSYPYRNDPTAYRTLSLKTEFMVMNVDGTGLRQLTHFNVPGYAESFPKGKGAVAACANWLPDRSRILAQSLRFPDYDFWEITFPEDKAPRAAK